MGMHIDGTYIPDPAPEDAPLSPAQRVALRDEVYRRLRMNKPTSFALLGFSRDDLLELFTDDEVADIERRIEERAEITRRKQANARAREDLANMLNAERAKAAREAELKLENKCRKALGMPTVDAPTVRTRFHSAPGQTTTL